jgi:hypothetical protein
VGVMKDKELQVEETETSHVLGGAGEVGVLSITGRTIHTFKN